MNATDIAFPYPALGVTMLHDSSTVMIGHYFKKRRELVEVIFCSAAGIGIATVSLATSILLRYFYGPKDLEKPTK